MCHTALQKKTSRKSSTKLSPFGFLVEPKVQIKGESPKTTSFIVFCLMPVPVPSKHDLSQNSIAFVEFQNKTIAKKMLGKKRSAKIQGRDVIVDTVGKRMVPKGSADKKNTQGT